MIKSLRDTCMDLMPTFAAPLDDGTFNELISGNHLLPQGNAAYSSRKLFGRPAIELHEKDVDWLETTNPVNIPNVKTAGEFTIISFFRTEMNKLATDIESQIPWSLSAKDNRGQNFIYPYIRDHDNKMISYGVLGNFLHAHGLNNVRQADICHITTVAHAGDVTVNINGKIQSFTGQVFDTSLENAVKLRLGTSKSYGLDGLIGGFYIYNRKLTVKEQNDILAAAQYEQLKHNKHIQYLQSLGPSCLLIPYNGTILDYSGNGKHATAYNMPAEAFGSPVICGGQELILDGIQRHLKFDTPIDFTGNEWSVLRWYQINQSIANGARLMTAEKEPLATHTERAFYDMMILPELRSGIATAEPRFKPQHRKWLQLATVYQKAEATNDLYLGNVRADQSANIPHPTGQHSHITVGARHNGTSAADISLGVIGLFQKALTPQQISKAYKLTQNKRTPTRTPGLCMGVMYNK